MLLSEMTNCLDYFDKKLEGLNSLVHDLRQQQSTSVTRGKLHLASEKITKTRGHISRMLTIFPRSVTDAFEFDVNRLDSFDVESEDDSDVDSDIDDLDDLDE